MYDEFVCIVLAIAMAISVNAFIPKWVKKHHWEEKYAARHQDD